MPAFMSLMKVSGQAAKNDPKRLKEIEDCITRAGGTWTSMYTVVGEYDYVWAFEMADEKAASNWMKDIDTRGDVKTTVLKNVTSVQPAKSMGR